MLRSFFAAGFAGQGLYKDHTLWLDGARLPQISLIMRLTNSHLDQLGPYILYYNQYANNTEGDGQTT